MDSFNNDNKDNNSKQVKYYSNGQFSDSSAVNSKADEGSDTSASGEQKDYANSQFRPENNSTPMRKKPFPSWAKALIVVGSIILFIVILGVGCSRFFSNITDAGNNQVHTGFGHDYIGTIYIESTIDEYGTGVYNHQYTLNAIDAMMEDSQNQGMILYINTPGGSVYASDELYFKIKEYQETTGRPVYSSMQSQATSGGYYISAPCDKIIANRNCWTGSIGVTMGNFIDLTEFLDKLGIKTETITSGPNKSMGSSTETMTAEQRAILQALIDESYEQFVEIVAEGRDMSVAEVKKLADGRIYSAQQAVDNGLVDQIGTYSEAVSDMMDSYDLDYCYVEHFTPDYQVDLSSLLGILEKQKGESNLTDADALKALIELNGTFRVSYISNVVK